MSFALNQEIMKKSFMMGDDGNRFTHNAAKKIKLFPFVTNNNALIIRTLSSVIGEWLRIVKKQKFQPRQMAETINNIVDNVDVDVGAKVCGKLTPSLFVGFGQGAYNRQVGLGRIRVEKRFDELFCLADGKPQLGNFAGGFNLFGLLFF